MGVEGGCGGNKNAYKGVLNKEMEFIAVGACRVQVASADHPRAAAKDLSYLHYTITDASQLRNSCSLLT